jgi:hypothetical protein
MLLPPVLLFDPRSRSTCELDPVAAATAIAEHRMAIVNPAPAHAELLALAWACLQPDPEAPQSEPRLVGPQIYFDPSGFTAPVLPIGGVTVGEALAAYVDAAPVGAKLIERGGKVRSQHVNDVNAAATLRPILRKQINADSWLMTDEASYYRAIGREFRHHYTVAHGIGEYVRGGAHTNTIEGFFRSLNAG